MRLRIVAAVLTLLVQPVAAYADLRLVWDRVSGLGEGRKLRMVETIAEGKHREDEIPDGRSPSYTTIRDLERMIEYRLWHEFKLLATQPLAPLTDKTDARSVAVNERVRTARGTPTGRTATIAGVACREFVFAATSFDQRFTVTGTFWRPARSDGDSAYAALYARLGMLGFPAEEGHVSKGNRGKNRGRLELQREFLAAARRDGIPFRYAFEVSGGGIAPLKERRELVTLETTPVSDDVFVIPPGYKDR